MQMHCAENRPQTTRVAQAITAAAFIAASSVLPLDVAPAAEETFESGGKPYKITMYPDTVYGDKRPIILVLHGNGNLIEPFGHQIKDVAKSLADRGYVTAVPQYYADDQPHLTDSNPVPHVPTLIAAIDKVAGRSDADPDRLGLLGYSLGAATAMTYIASNPRKVQVLADFFGPTHVNPDIIAKAGNFPPTIIFHDKLDQIVSVEDSRKLKKSLPSTIQSELHEYDEPKQSLMQGGNHAFREGGNADVESRKRAADWLVEHLKPVGK
jgi:dienelactone hydrolase